MWEVADAVCEAAAEEVLVVFSVLVTCRLWMEELTNIMTRWPRLTMACASLETVMQDVEMPWIKRIFSPSSGPHSYTRIIPY